MTVRRFAIAALLALTAFAARADWEGDVEMKGPMMAPRPQSAPPGGKVRFKDGKMRMDMQMGAMEMTTLVDFAARKAFIINHGAKAYSEISGDQPGGAHEGLPRCSAMKFAACMKEQGFKKTGSETVNGQASSIWEGERKMRMGSRHEKLWHPDAAGDEF